MVLERQRVLWKEKQMPLSVQRPEMMLSATSARIQLLRKQRQRPSSCSLTHDQLRRHHEACTRHAANENEERMQRVFSSIVSCTHITHPSPRQDRFRMCISCASPRYALKRHCTACRCCRSSTSTVPLSRPSLQSISAALPPLVRKKEGRQQSDAQKGRVCEMIRSSIHSSV